MDGGGRPAYKPAMRKPVTSRRIIALAAAYVVVLQALLLPLAVAAGSPFITGLCMTSGEHVPASPSQDSACPCAAGCGMQCGAQALAAPPFVSITHAFTAGITIALSPALAPAIRAGLRHPQNPRAPPAA